MALPAFDTLVSGASYDILVTDALLTYFHKPVVVDGTKSRDTRNSSHLYTILPGMPFGKISASGKWAPSIIGVTRADYTDDGLLIPTSGACATEVARRIGASGSVKIVGSTDGSADCSAAVTVAYSSVVTSPEGSAGLVVLSTAYNANMKAGGFILPADGSETIWGVLNGDALCVQKDGVDSDVALTNLIIGGYIRTARLAFYPTLAAYIKQYKAWLRANKMSWFFDDDV